MNLKTEKTASNDIKTRREEEILEAAATSSPSAATPRPTPKPWPIAWAWARALSTAIFPPSGELFLAAVDRLMSQLHENITDVISDDFQDPIDRLLHAMNAYLKFFSDRPELVELLIQERAYFKDRAKPTFIEHSEKFVQTMAGRVSRHDRRGPRSGNAL